MTDNTRDFSRDERTLRGSLGRCGGGCGKTYEVSELAPCQGLDACTEHLCYSCREDSEDLSDGRRFPKHRCTLCKLPSCADHLRIHPENPDERWCQECFREHGPVWIAWDSNLTGGRMTGQYADLSVARAAMRYAGISTYEVIADPRARFGGRGPEDARKRGSQPSEI